jgi:maltose/moltooligosaccharide transporter
MKVLKQILREPAPLFAVQFFTWLALFALWIYATPMITRYVFNGTDPGRAGFEDGTRWASALLLTVCWPQCLIFLSPGLTKKRAFTGCMLCPAGRQPGPVADCPGEAALYGVAQFFIYRHAWSSIGSIPYTIIGRIADVFRKGKKDSGFKEADEPAHTQDDV